MENRKKVVLSGIRATGQMHLGNYLGAMRHFVQLSKDLSMKCFFFVADLHTLTTLKDRQQMAKHLPNIVLDYLAAGIDPNVATLYAQSSVPEISELFWLLCNFMPVADLLLCPSYKDKASKNPQNAGLLNYPVLMAADILAPRGELIPVGHDQIPHVEMARQLARDFNKETGEELFPIPEHLGGESITVKGLHGEGKMGKSEKHDSTIFLTDDNETVWSKLRTAVTDPNRKRRSDPGNPSVCNVFTLHTLLSPDEKMREMAEGCRTAKIGCIDCKKELMIHVWRLLEEFQANRTKILQNGGADYVGEVLIAGGRKARAEIQFTVQRVQELMGVATYL